MVSAVFCMWVVGSTIVMGLYVLDMWSVLCVLYVGGGVLNSDRTVRTGHVVSVVLCMRVVCSNIVIGLYILDMWSVLFVPYVCGGI